MSFFSKFLGNSKERAAKQRVREKELAQTGTINDRLKLAKDKKTSPDILYYLAEHDEDPAVRKAVATNMATPIQASSVLVQDTSVDVRLALAERLMKLLPNISADIQSQLYAYAVNSLGALALDEVLKIRVALSSTLKDHAYAPPKVVAKLARDIEREVSEPILRYCVALPDEDLLEILQAHPASWAVQAVASRPSLSEAVSDAVIETEDAPAGQILLNNTGAEVSMETLGKIVEMAKTIPQWQKPLALRKGLPANFAKALALYVDQSIRDILLERSDLDGQTVDEISKIVKRRIAHMDEEETSGKSAAERLKEKIKKGALNDEAVTDAIGVRDREFAELALAHLSKIPVAEVQKILALNAPKPATALVWKAGLSMRTALIVQRELARVPPGEVLNPRNGTEYPLSEEDLRWQLDFLGIN
ncbi:MAG: DUF2336 domain-containing protein [Pseudobdellovibrionaceae bacterium]